jgi:Bardet-Biedl syndrome 7 protein
MLWISSCLNDVPTQTGESEEVVKMYFKSTFIDTIIIVEISPGVLEVRSDNLSAITIIKDHVSSEVKK